MTRGCLRIAVKTCGAQDLNRGYADGHLCECDAWVAGGALLDGRPIPDLKGHGPTHHCGECGRTFTLDPPVDLTGLPGVPT